MKAIRTFPFFSEKKNVRDNCALETGQKITYSLLNLKKTGTRCFTFNSNENE